MTNTHKLQSALRAIPGSDFANAAQDLLAAIGYESAKTLPGQTGEVYGFIAAFPAPNPGTQDERDFTDAALSARLLFQITDAEINAAAPHQAMLLETSESFDEGRENSFLFVAVELNGDSYPRGKYAQFTRDINKRLSAAPTVALFRTSNGHLTLAFVHRRANKRDPNRSVLGSVSLIREIDPTSPHRAHLDILQELSLDHRLKWMDLNGKPHNFDGLLDAWLDALDTEELNRRFYRELFAWFERAVKGAKFPTGEPKTLPAEEHVIRLITRLLFIWFSKEKGLVAPELFIEERVRNLLKDYDRDTGDSYYRAVLQNLFFATLNTEIERPGFSSQSNTTHRDFSRYRFRDEIADEDALLELLSKTPFINGGLFDCLDSEAATGDGGYRIDCFSDNRAHRSLLSIPNRLFFDESTSARGLIPLFNRYKFTVEENTPTEQEVALDPELLGKVFENLLAAYNPETRETARKQTGSYYTPRPVVDYMVDEALVESLAEKVQPTDGDGKFWRERLHYLLDYADAFDDANDLFDSTETQGLIEAVAEIKVLDPAVGSGAFPMAVLHKLTLALRRLDPDNTLWETLQKDIALSRTASAFDSRTQQERDTELQDISDTFERYRGSDFGRKLYLIQNSIFGVDIQSVATQIAKLRFFISLAIEQQPNDDPNDNYGVKPLPNLETRFVAANTLLPLQNQEGMLTSERTRDLQRQLVENRERHFHATDRRRKLAIRNQDKRLRKDLAAELRQVGLAAYDADRIADWDPYDQNANADWFDPGYMFGVHDGFDVVIGNPPYVRADSGQQHLDLRRRIDASGYYETLWEKWDLYVAFIERGYKLLRPSGFTTMIVSDAYCHAKYAQRSREWFLKNGRIIRLDFFSKIRIFDAAIRNITYLFQKADGLLQSPERRVHDPGLGMVTLLRTGEQQGLTDRAFFPEDPTIQQFTAPTLTLNEICYISVGMVVHADEKRAQGAFDLSDLVSDGKDALHPKPFVEGKHLARWLPATNRWLEWSTARAPNLFRRPTFPELYDVREKLISVDMAAGVDQLRVAYDDGQLYHNHSAGSFVPWHSLSGIRNRSIKLQTRYRDETPRRPDLPEREQLERTSRRFDVKFLLGVMNSTTARDFLRSNRRSNIHLYPDDWKKLPIPDVPPSQQTPIVELVNQILAAKSTDPDADTSELEEAIDWLVYELYGLTDEETAEIADTSWDGQMSEEEEDAALVRAMEGDPDSGRGGMKELREILREWDEA